MCGIFCYVGESLSTIKIQDNFSRIDTEDLIIVYYKQLMT